MKFQKEMIRLTGEVRELLPDLLLTLGSIEQINPPPEILGRIQSLRAKLEKLMEQAHHLEESTDCMPAADLGRKQNR